jgi:hypothetical protein
MADFSKQWCELNDKYMPHDFDILEEFEKLPKDHYIPIICEGFGFIAIMRDHEDRCLLAFRDNNGDVIWEDYDQFMDRNINRNKIETTDLKNTLI